MVDLSYKKEWISPKQDNYQNGFIWIIKGEKSRTRKIKEEPETEAAIRQVVPEELERAAHN